jgi:hypothetical protein
MNKARGFLWVLAVLPLAWVCHAKGIMPEDRSTAWNPGIPGGIPARTSVCSTVSAASYGNGSSDATRGIQSALDSCPPGKIVQLSAGTFKIASGPLRLTKGITLRGAGPTQTLLKAPDGTNQAVVVIGQQWVKYGGSTNFTSNAVKEANSVTVASTSGLSVGQLVVIDETVDSSLSYYSSDCGAPCRAWFSRQDRPLAQMMEISALNGKTVTFSTPFHIGFDTAHTAQLTTFPAPAVRSAGLEELKVYGGEGGDGGGNIYLELAMYSWVRHVESQWSVGASVRLYKSLRCVIRDSYFHETKDPNPGGAGYGIDLSVASADNLVENNISWAFNKVILTRASGGGNVIAYNYMDDGYGAGYKSIPEIGLNASHMTTPHYELFEGNESWQLGSDARWGNSIYITFFRNHATGLRRNAGGVLGLSDTNNRRAVTVSARHYWYTFIGNVLGFQGMTPAPFAAFTYEDPYPYSNSVAAMWRFGVPDSVGTADIRTSDPQSAATALRDGNFDYVTNSVKWDRTPQPIPDSLYLTSKPEFFGNCQWPWVDPLGATKLYTLPARARFDGNPSPCGVPAASAE